MTEETAQALVTAMNAHTKAMEVLAHELSVFDTYSFEDAVSDLTDLFNESKVNAYQR